MWIPQRTGWPFSGRLRTYFFEEIARIRAIRRLWYKIMKYRFNAKNPRAMLMRCHVQTSGVCLIQEEPRNNIIRSAYHALAAVLGGRPVPPCGLLR